MGLDVVHLTERLPQDADDCLVFQTIASEGRCLLTRDLAIRSNQRLRHAIRDYDIGAFFLGGKNRSGRELIVQAVKAATLMEEKAASAKRPFAFIVSPGGGTIERLELD